MLEQRIQQQFFDSADLQYQTAEALSRPIAEAAQALTGCITCGGKLLVGGTGGAAALAQHFCAAWVDRFERERPGLAALSLASDSALLTRLPAPQVFAKQVQALGQGGDVLLLIDGQVHGHAHGQVFDAAITAAHARDANVVLLASAAAAGAAALQAKLKETDVLLAVPHERAARVLEMQLLVLHCLCDAVDVQLMGEQDSA